jgi:hypothetical protein
MQQEGRRKSSALINKTPQKLGFGGVIRVTGSKVRTGDKWFQK